MSELKGFAMIAIGAQMSHSLMSFTRSFTPTMNGLGSCELYQFFTGRSFVVVLLPPGGMTAHCETPS